LLTALLLACWFALGRRVDRLEDALGRELERVESLDGLVGDANARIEQSYQRMEQARSRRESALSRIKEAESVVSAAAEERSEADSLTEEALGREQAARELAEEARRRAEAERRRREEEWSRLGRALGKVAPTTRGDWTLTADLGPGFAGDKEKISRLAGILLAHHGYRATVAGEGAEQAVAYLKGAGIPDDILTRGEASGRLRLALRDQILRR
jgi:hypothetical protein